MCGEDRDDEFSQLRPDLYAVEEVYMYEGIYEAFRDSTVKYTEVNIKTGKGTEEGVVVGPVQDKM
jgi:hypothetical protein